MTPGIVLLGKKEGLKIPLTKYLIGPLELMTYGRETKDSKEVRSQLVEDIIAR